MAQIKTKVARKRADMEVMQPHEQLNRLAQAVQVTEPVEPLTIDGVSEEEIIGSFVSETQEKHDDRKDIVEVTYGQGEITSENFQVRYKEKMTKEDAVDKLVVYYQNQKTPVPPNEDKFGDKVNDAPCYVRVTKRNYKNGKKFTYYKDFPLWLLADRIIDRPRINFELVPRYEYLLYLAKDIRAERTANNRQRSVILDKALKEIEKLEQS